MVWRGATRRIDGRADAWLGPWLERWRDDTRSPAPIAKVTVVARDVATDAHEAFSAHAVANVEELTARLAAGNGPHDARNVKRIRTALRRLRALVRETAPDEDASDHDRGLRRAGKRLGAIRDVDVVLGWIAARRAASGSDLERAALDELEARLARARESAVTRAARRLDPSVVRELVNDVQRFVVRLVVDEPFATRWWRSAHAELVDALQSASPTDADLEVLHRIRIAARRARYALDWLGPLATAEAREWKADALALQRAIGAHRDAALLHERLRDEIERATSRRRITLARGLEASAIAARSERTRTFAAAQRIIAAATTRASLEPATPQLLGSDAASSPTRSPPGRSGRA
jgi:CHAD domain-containing protein